MKIKSLFLLLITMLTMSTVAHCQTKQDSKLIATDSAQTLRVIVLNQSPAGGAAFTAIVQRLVAGFYQNSDSILFSVDSTGAYITSNRNIRFPSLKVYFTDTLAGTAGLRKGAAYIDSTTRGLYIKK